MPSIRELGHNPRTPARHGPQPRYGCGLVVDPFGQYAQIVDLRRTWHHPTPAPPRQHHPPSVHHDTHNSQPVSAQSPTQGPPDDQAICATRLRRGGHPCPTFSVAPRAHLAKRRTRPMAPPAYGRPPDGTAATRALPASPQAQHGASRGSEDRQGQPVTTHCPSWRRPPMTTQATTTYDERFPAVTKPTAPTGCKAHRPWTPERAATATPNGR